MQISAESRWFWTEDGPESLRKWFFAQESANFPDTGAEKRTDAYFEDRGQAELGIKIRNYKSGDAAAPGQLQIKGLVSKQAGTCTLSSLDTNIEIWGKWNLSATAMPTTPVLLVNKTRWIRAFDTSSGSAIEVMQRPFPILQSGCNVEYSRLSGAFGNWVSLGLESFGKLSEVVDSLLLVSTLMNSHSFPAIDGGVACSYPVWLRARVTSS